MRLLLLILMMAAPANARADAIRKLDFLVGEWSGEGWIVTGRDPQRVTFHQTESVRYAAGGTVVVIDGLGRNEAGDAVHQAFAVVSFDRATKKYTWRAFTAAQGETAVEPQIGDESLVWGFPSPGGQVRFTINAANGQWREIGEFSRDGAAWSKFFEMNLKRSTAGR